jgi:hypothetical protein
VYKYRYKEIPGKGHWWSIDSLGTSCVDDPDLMEYVEGLRRDSCPSHIVFKTTDLGKSSRAYWTRITEQEQPFRESRIEARLMDADPNADPALNTIEIETQNVSEFTIAPCPRIAADHRMRVRVDGTEWVTDLEAGGHLTFSKRAGRFRMGETRYNHMRKTPELFGPIKQAYFSPFVLVYGTMGDSATTDLLLNQARIEATQWWIRGNGFAEILPDTEVTAEILSDYNLILFGGPGENRVTGTINRQLPIKMIGERFFAGGREIEGAVLAAEFVCPNPLSQDKLVIVHEGIGFEGLKMSTFFGTLYSAAGLPDYMVFDPSVKQRGWAGVTEAGFFDSNWQIEK